MDWFLCIAALLFFWAGHPASALLLRVGLGASLRFSPRAALALSSMAALSGACTGLICRGGLRTVPRAQLSVTACASLVGGALGRAALLMLDARLSSSLLLTRLQMLPLLLLAFLSLIPTSSGKLQIPLSRMRLFFFSLLCAATDGFFGAGGMPLFSLTALGGVRRRRDTPSCALLMTAVSQSSAILLTLLCGETQIFPTRMLVLLIAGSVIGTIVTEKQKERGPSKGMRTALKAYLILAALSCIEQAL